jgi:hypothetical protein
MCAATVVSPSSLACPRRREGIKKNVFLQPTFDKPTLSRAGTCTAAAHSPLCCRIAVDEKLRCVVVNLSAESGAETASAAESKHPDRFFFPYKTEQAL